MDTAIGAARRLPSGAPQARVIGQVAKVISQLARGVGRVARVAHLARVIGQLARVDHLAGDPDGAARRANPSLDRGLLSRRVRRRLWPCKDPVIYCSALKC